MPWKCFVVVSTEKQRVYRRRYSTAKCPSKWGYHTIKSDHYDVVGGEQHPEVTSQLKTDGKWPEKCVCGYQFQDNDIWQLFCEFIFIDESGNEYTLSTLPPGGMYQADWLIGDNAAQNSHLPPWMVMLPGGMPWHFTGPAKDDKTGWTITGSAPQFTAQPSILTPEYHGFLINGVLSDDTDGRKY